MDLYVNGQRIDAEMINAEVERLRPSYRQMFADQPKDEQEKRLAEWSRENVIEAVLFQQEARRVFPEVSEEEIRAVVDSLREQEGRPGPMEALTEEQQTQIADRIRQEKLQHQVTSAVAGPSDKEIRRYYQQHLDRFTIPESVHAAHLVRHPKPGQAPEELRREMEENLARLQSGTPFEQLAAEHSDCPDQAGDLGFFTRGKMVAAFEEVVFSLEPGTTSGIFETEFGLHIAKVYERRPACPVPLEQVRQVVVRELGQEKSEKAMERLVDSLKARARIEER